MTRVTHPGELRFALTLLRVAARVLSFNGH